MADIVSLGIKVTTAGVSKASTELDTLTKSAGKAEKSAHTLGAAWGKAFGVGAGVLAVAGIGAIIKNTIEAEKAQAQLAAVLKSTAGAAGLAAGELNSLASALQATSIFDDEAITGAESLLLTFTKIGRDVFPAATQAVLDMSQALGQDLKSSALQIGKALNDPIAGITALTRAGVSFSESQKDLIGHLVDTGHAAEAQAIVLRELQKEFGGSAQAARNTLGGALQGLENDFANLLEGDSGSEGIRGTVDAVNSLGATMRSENVRQGFATIISGMAGMASAAALAAAGIANLLSGVDALGRSESLKKYDELLDREQTLRAQIANGGASPFEPGGARSVSSLKAELAEVKKLTAAYRDAHQAKAGTPSGSPARGEPRNATVLIAHDPALWNTGGSGAARTAMRGLEDTLGDLQRKIAETQQANDEFTHSLEDMQALLDGPLAKAELDHNRRLADLDELAKRGEVSSEKLRAAKEAEEALYRREKVSIEERLDVGGQALKELQFELSLLSMTNAERATAIQLRDMDAASVAKYGDAIAAANAKIELDHQKIAALDDFRGAFKDTLADVLTGSESIKDAFKSLADTIIDQIARIVASNISDSLFGAAGTNQTGSAGGLLSQLFGSLFGGGRASGGSVEAGRLYEVGENDNAEMFMAGGRQYLIPGNAGSVKPMQGGERDKGRTVNVTNNFTLHGEGSKLSQNQIAAKVREAVLWAQRTA